MIDSLRTRIASALQDSHLHTTLARSTRRLRRWRQDAFAAGASFGELQAAAQRIRQGTLTNLPALLTQLEAQVTARGGKVHWAEDADAACQTVLELVKQASRRPGLPGRGTTILHSQGVVSQEIGLLAALEAAGHHVLESQLGHYVVQLAGQPGSHPVLPALHARREDVARLFRERLDMPETLDVEVMGAMARFQLHRELPQANVGIVDAAFAVAETGTVALMSQSGDERLVALAVPVLVVLLGLDQVVATLEELLLLLQVWAQSAVGQSLAGSVSLLSGPARPDEPGGPEQLYLVLVDNGRSELLKSRYRSVLTCIHCGACINACPVYREIGGYTYDYHLSGPIGAVLAPLRPQLSSPISSQESSSRRPWAVWSRRQTRPALTSPTAELPWASTLCGACAEVCPVGIDLPDLLVWLRGDLNQAGHASLFRRLAARFWTWTMADVGRYRWLASWLGWGGRLLGRGPLHRGRLPPPFRGWSRSRDLPLPARQTFRQRWAQREQRSEAE